MWLGCCSTGHHRSVLRYPDNPEHLRVDPDGVTMRTAVTLTITRQRVQDRSNSKSDYYCSRIYLRNRVQDVALRLVQTEKSVHQFLVGARHYREYFSFFAILSCKISMAHA